MKLVVSSWTQDQLRWKHSSLKKTLMCFETWKEDSEQAHCWDGRRSSPTADPPSRGTNPGSSPLVFPRRWSPCHRPCLLPLHKQHQQYRTRVGLQAFEGSHSHDKRFSKTQQEQYSLICCENSINYKVPNYVFSKPNRNGFFCVMSSSCCFANLQQILSADPRVLWTTSSYPPYLMNTILQTTPGLHQPCPY